MAYSSTARLINTSTDVTFTNDLIAVGEKIVFNSNMYTIIDRRFVPNVSDGLDVEYLVDLITPVYSWDIP